MKSSHIPIGAPAEAQYEGSGLTGVVEGYGFDQRGTFYYLLRLNHGFWSKEDERSACFVSLLTVEENNLERL